ncbi:hydroxyacid aldolase [Rhodobacteraceae bacterium RKSG542]|uniref:HpcH/HpaI aldolase family protein n=1 Tax=Pseudovibrio flavus TaxID=2529854 RepID=UPI0012BB9E79|nr:aldolase/citrate lyase family protein [Pseudovibrio flavus]MTI19318.1 hydroxyacid aldolase [Pseudovibrio flavus]
MSLENGLAAKLRRGESVLCAWSALGLPSVCQLMVKSGYSSVLVDLQHGFMDHAEARDSIGLVVGEGAHAVLRICVGDFARASWFLDAGAEAIVAPMINTEADAKAFVEFTKYPPLGERSYGAMRASMLHDTAMPDYFKAANEQTLAIAMIETQEAVDNLDAILSVEGIDGVFVGPADLAISVSNGERVDPASEASLALQKQIAQTALKFGKFAGIYGLDADHVKVSAQAGFQFITSGSDAGMIREGSAAASSVLAGVKEPSSDGSSLY